MIDANAQIIDLGYKPRPFQAALHKALKRFSVAVCHRRFGKCLVAKTIVQTARGPLYIKDLSVGDIVFGWDGEPAVVTDTYFGGNKQIYEVVFDNDEIVRTDDDHLWYVEPSFSEVGVRGNRFPWRCGKHLTTKELLGKKLFIPTVSLNYSKKDLLIDPYWFGYWLGNGNKDAATLTVTNGDEHLFDTQSSQKDYGGGCTRMYFSDIQWRLKELGVFENKHIPEIYLQSSIEQRIELLRGLMDSDGTVSSSGTCRFDNKNERLIEGTFRLISSLGLIPYKHVYHRGSEKEFYILFSAKDFFPFKLERKIALCRLNNRPLRHKIKEVRLTDTFEDVFCITVDSPKHLFCITNSNIPTHNTYFSLRHLQMRMLQNKQTRPQYAYIAPTYAQAKKVAWDYAKEFFSKLPGFKSFEQELKIEIDHPHIPGDKCVFWLIGSDNPDSIRGVYLDGVVIDEYAQIAPSLWGKVVFPTLVDRGGWCIFIGTPSGHNHFSKLYHEAEEAMLKSRESDWFAITLRASQTKVIPEGELAIVRANSTEEDYKQEFECDWSAANKGTYYDSYMTKAEDEGRITSVPYDPAALVHTAWDLGIDDHMVIWFYQVVGKEIHIIDHIEDNDKGLDHYLKIVREKQYTYGTHFFPHDANQRELTNGGRARIEVIREVLGNNCEVLPRIGVEDGINAVRMIINRCWFDKKLTYRGVLALKNYRKKFNEKLNTYAGAVHDEFSHSADGFRCLALSLSKDLGRMNDVRGKYSQFDKVEAPSDLWGF